MHARHCADDALKTALERAAAQLQRADPGARVLPDGGDLDGAIREALRPSELEGFVGPSGRRAGSAHKEVALLSLPQLLCLQLQRVTYDAEAGRARKLDASVAFPTICITVSNVSGASGVGVGSNVAFTDRAGQRLVGSVKSIRKNAQVLGGRGPERAAWLFPPWPGPRRGRGAVRLAG